MISFQAYKLTLVTTILVTVMLGSAIFQFIFLPEKKLFSKTLDGFTHEILVHKGIIYSDASVTKAFLKNARKLLNTGFSNYTSYEQSINKILPQPVADEFIRFLTEQGIKRKIVEKHYILSMLHTAPPIVTARRSVGREQRWKVEMPILLSLTDAKNTPTTKKYIFSALMISVGLNASANGLAIKKFSFYQDNRGI